LPAHASKEGVQLACEAKLTSSVSSKRYRLRFMLAERAGSVGDQLCAAIGNLPADFIVMGFFGVKGRKRGDYVKAELGSSLATVLNHGNSSSLICIKDDSVQLLPIKFKKGVFVVSVSLNKSSTKAFLDALRLSKPGDEIHVIYVKSYLEREDSDYTAQVRLKYEGFFESFRDPGQAVFSRYHDRLTKFELIAKGRRETIAQAVVRYADEVEADFLVVGANSADRVARGKQPVGSVSLQACLLTDRNFVIAKWIDIAPAIYEGNVRRACTPSARS